MARINLEILFYLIWTKLLVWTRCPQLAGTQPPQPRWARSGPQICHCDHGVHMKPRFFNSRPFMQQIRSTSLLWLDLVFYPETVSQENWNTFNSFLLCCVSLACLHALKNWGRRTKKKNITKSWKTNNSSIWRRNIKYLNSWMMFAIKVLIAGGHEF